MRFVCQWRQACTWLVSEAASLKSLLMTVWMLQQQWHLQQLQTFSNFPSSLRGLPGEDHSSFGVGVASPHLYFDFHAGISFVNYTGLAIVGWAAVLLGVISLSPFIIMSFIAIPKIQPHRWLSLGQKGVKRDWNLFFNTLFWNLNFWDNVSTLAGEVDKPQKTFPRALLVAVVFNCLAYLVLLFAVIGAFYVDQRDWGSEFHADAVEMIAGKWLKVWIKVGAVLSAIGLFEPQLSSCAYQLEGMANLAILPKLFGNRSKWFNNPWVGILLSTLITIGMSYMNFIDIISSSNCLIIGF
ncbi:hypothetical protein J1N35_032914 [Gossypium stocksii]|uniref:Amino acid permease/ SLC12A domain-containing protein n=1 Tax=Gossypium stocksii TaxID=47602 RepID=A0A9D3ZWK8_9ROSI|nr:hypothetical protein J1N35_032914 [Gossypium stocksii]